MVRIIIIIVFSILLHFSSASAQKAEKEDMLKGINFIETLSFSDEENEELISLFDGLRVADVSDGLDKAGLPGTGLVDQSIHPLWIDLNSFSHRICGIALTVRYVPTQRPDRPDGGETFQKWLGRFYSNYSSEPFKSIIKPGTVVVIDDVSDNHIGTLGSNNLLGWVERGAAGIITDGCCRDTDEVAKQQIPVYLKHIGKSIRPGRNELESVNRPVEIEGVLVCPGDIVVADGDGVVIVPRKAAREVALYARKTIDKDKNQRRELYKRLGKPLDKTVK